MDYKKIMKDLREDHDLTQEQVAHLANHVRPLRARRKRTANPAFDYPMPLLPYYRGSFFRSGPAGRIKPAQTKTRHEAFASCLICF